MTTTEIVRPASRFEPTHGSDLLFELLVLPFQPSIQLRSGGIPSHAEVDVNDLAMLSAGADEGPPTSSDRQVGLIHAPALADRRALCPRRINEARGKRVDPIVDGAGIDGDPPSASHSATST